MHMFISKQLRLTFLLILKGGQNLHVSCDFGGAKIDTIVEQNVPVDRFLVDVSLELHKQ